MTFKTVATGHGKTITKQTQRFLETIGWKNQIEKLKRLRTKRDEPLHFFDWKLDFPEIMNEHVADKTGFDIVIGNPPYIQLQKDSGKLAVELKDENYQTLIRTGDVYCIFYERGFQLLNTNGVLTYITSSQWTKAAYGKPLRKYLLNQNPLRLLLLGPGVFESATVDTNILIGEKGSYKKELKGVQIDNLSQIGQDDLKMIDMPYIGENNWAILNPVKQRRENQQTSQGLGCKNKFWNKNRTQRSIRN